MGDNSSLSTRYSYTELNCDSIQGAAKSGAYPAADWANFYFTQKEYIVAGLKVVHAQIPFIYDVVTANNQRFFWQVGALAEIFLGLEIGTFTGPEIATYLTNLLTLSSLNPVTVTWDSTALRFTFTCVDPFTFRFENVSPRVILGFPEGSTSATFDGLNYVLTSPNVAMITGPTYLYLNSATIGPAVNCHAQDNTVGINQICRIPVDVNPGGIISFRDPNPDQFFDFQTTSDFTNFDLYLTLGLPGMGEFPIDMKGVGFNVTLGIYQYRRGGALEQPGNITFNRR